MISLSFITTSLLIILLPGVGAIYTLSTGLTLGKGKGVVAAIGCTLSIIPHLCLGIIGIFIVTLLNPRIIFSLQILGGCYLIYLGLKMIISTNDIELTNTSLRTKNSKIIIQAILINLLNPKLTLFFLSFLPQFLDPKVSNNLENTIVLGLVFTLLSLVIFIFYGLLAGSLKHIIEEKPKSLILVQRVFGMIFIVFALRLMLVS